MDFIFVFYVIKYFKTHFLTLWSEGNVKLSSSNGSTKITDFCLLDEKKQACISRQNIGKVWMQGVLVWQCADPSYFTKFYTTKPVL